MGCQLWVSDVTGKRRNGTDFESLKSIFIDSVTAKAICEPLHACRLTDHAADVRRVLIELDFDSAGVIDANERVIGYINRDELNDGLISEQIQEIKVGLLISDSTPIADIVHELKERKTLFVNYGSNISYIITRADLNKPPVRIFIFGMISLLEMHLNFWVSHFCPEEHWDRSVPPERIAFAHQKLQEAKKNSENTELTLVNYLQFCDKKELLRDSPDFISELAVSKTQLKDYLRWAEGIRNDIAHSQNSIFTNISIDRFSDVIVFIETFLNRSESYLSHIKKVNIA